MTQSVAQIWRHPIKSHGREQLAMTDLRVGKCLPFDRAWAVAHDASAADGSQWEPCQNFSRGAKAPALMAIDATWDEKSRKMILRHPDLGEIAFNPDTDADAFVAWSAPLMPAGRAASARMVSVPDRGMTDTDFPSIALLNMASHRDVAKRADCPDLSALRWRGNFWIEGLEPWAEMNWIGREVQIGNAVLRIREQITRCLATTANPETGARDVDTLAVLQTLGHQEFGIYAEVIRDGSVRVDDKVTLL
jgi:uncharacterized protein YcbX